MAEQNLETNAAAVLRRLENARARLARAEGALQASEQELAALRAQCESMGIDPDRIDDQIRSQEQQLASKIAEYSGNLDQIEEVLRSINY